MRNGEDCARWKAQVEDGLIERQEDKSKLQVYLEARDSLDADCDGSVGFFKMYDEAGFMQRARILPLIEERVKNVNERWEGLEGMYNGAGGLGLDYVETRRKVRSVNYEAGDIEFVFLSRGIGFLKGVFDKVPRVVLKDDLEAGQLFG